MRFISSFTLLWAVIISSILCSPKETSLHNSLSTNTDPYKHGDLLFQNLDCGELCDAIESVTSGYANSDYTHVGIVIIDSTRGVRILDANTEHGVSITPLDSFLAKTENPILHMRLDTKYQGLINASVDRAMTRLGDPYDYIYQLNDNHWYCSELVYDAYRDKDSLPLFELHPMTFKQPDSEEYFPSWSRYYSDLGIPIPEGELGINPGGISRSEHLDFIGYIK